MILISIYRYMIGQLTQYHTQKCHTLRRFDAYVDIRFINNILLKNLSITLKALAFNLKVLKHDLTILDHFPQEPDTY